MQPGRAPLIGVRVLDLSRLLPGPYASLVLADLGATVIKVEAPGTGDYLRAFTPISPDGTSWLFHALNRGKHSVVLDLKSPQGRQDFLQLCKSADVLLESFRPGVMARLGLGPCKLVSQFPRLIVCSISGYGQSGRHRLRAGHDINYAADAGALGLAKTPGIPVVQTGDLMGGAWPAVVQILAALHARTSSGLGCCLDVSMRDGVLSALVMPLAARAGAGVAVDAGRFLLNGGVPCYRVYATKQGYLSVGALEPKFWAAFLRVIGLDDVLPVGSGTRTGAAAQRVVQQVQQALMQRTADEWMALMQQHRVDACVEPVRSPHTVLPRADGSSGDGGGGGDDDERSMFVPVAVNGAPAPVPMVRPPLDHVGLHLRPSTAPGPRHGQHNALYLPTARL